MPTRIDEYLASIIQTADSIRNSLSPKVIQTMGPEKLGVLIAEVRQIDRLLGEAEAILQ